MNSVGEALRSSGLSFEERSLLGLVPIHRREVMGYHGAYFCPVSGYLTVILEDEVLGHFILCSSSDGGFCFESPSVFAALEGVNSCDRLWRVM